MVDAGGQKAGSCVGFRLVSCALLINGHAAADRMTCPVGDLGHQSFDLVADEIEQLDAAPGVRQGSLEPLNGYLNRKGRVRHPVKGIHPTRQASEQVLGSLAGQADCAMLSYETSRAFSNGAVTGPEEGVAPRTDILQGSYQGRVPVRGPAADNQAIFVQDAAQRGGENVRVHREFVDGVPLIEIRVVSVQLDYGDPSVGERCRGC